MSILFWFAVFFMWWWITLLAVLPWGVRTAADDESSVQIGNAASAPVNPMLAKKFIITTIIALCLTLSIRWIVEDSGYSIRPVLQMMGMKIPENS